MKTVFNFLCCLLFTAVMVGIGALLMSWPWFQQVVAFFDKYSWFLFTCGIIWLICPAMYDSFAGNFFEIKSRLLFYSALGSWIIIGYLICVIMVVTAPGDVPPL